MRKALVLFLQHLCYQSGFMPSSNIPLNAQERRANYLFDLENHFYLLHNKSSALFSLSGIISGVGFRPKIIGRSDIVCTIFLCKSIWF